mgnify:CR=1 FL=1
MKEERLQILRMIQEGIISAEEGASLLSAMQSSEEKPASGGARRVVESPVLPHRWVRIRVIDKSNERTRVNLTIPIGLLDWGLRLAESMGGLNMSKLRTLIYGGLNGGELLDLESDESNERVVITLE